MKKQHGDKSIESQKIFPYIAWIIVILFLIIIYGLIREMADVQQKLQEDTQELNDKYRKTGDELRELDFGH